MANGPVGLSTPGRDRSEEVGDDFGVLPGAETPLPWTRRLNASASMPRLPITNIILVVSTSANDGRCMICFV